MSELKRYKDAKFELEQQCDFNQNSADETEDANY